MIRFIKRLFCTHSYNSNFVGVMTCRKCGKVHKDNFYTRKPKTEHHSKHERPQHNRTFKMKISHLSDENARTLIMVQQASTEIGPYQTLAMQIKNMIEQYQNSPLLNPNDIYAIY